MKYDLRKITRPIYLHQMGFWRTGMPAIDGLYKIKYEVDFYSAERESVYDKWWMSIERRIQYISQTIVVSIDDHESVDKWANEFAKQQIKRMDSRSSEFQRYRQHGTEKVRPILFVNFEPDIEIFHERMKRHVLAMFEPVEASQRELA